MSIDISSLKTRIPYFTNEILEEISEFGQLVELEENVEILREGQYIKVIPIVISGVIKVFTRHDDKDLLLYYIKPDESCIMSFTSGLKNEPSKVYAVTEAKSKVLLLPREKIITWVNKFPSFNTLFFNQFNTRYSDLLDTINRILFDKMDKRLYNYLVEKSTVSGQQIIQSPHRQIASELGTAREVVSRVLKKLENEGFIIQSSKGIKVL